MRTSITRRTIGALTAAGLLVLAACEPDREIVTHTSMGGLSMGMAPSEAHAATGANPDPVFHFEVANRTWTAEYYRHLSGIAASRYLALYDESGLRYWGFVHEFERQPSAEIARAARRAEREYAEWWRERASDRGGAGL